MTIHVQKLALWPVWQSTRREVRATPNARRATGIERLLLAAVVVPLLIFAPAWIVVGELAQRIGRSLAWVSAQH